MTNFKGQSCCSNWANRALHSVPAADKFSNCLALGWGGNSYWWYIEVARCTNVNQYSYSKLYMTCRWNVQTTHYVCL